MVMIISSLDLYRFVEEACVKLLIMTMMMKKVLEGRKLFNEATLMIMEICFKESSHLPKRNRIKLVSKSFKRNYREKRDHKRALRSERQQNA